MDSIKITITSEKPASVVITEKKPEKTGVEREKRPLDDVLTKGEGSDTKGGL